LCPFPAAIFPCLNRKLLTAFSQSGSGHAAVLAKVLFANSFWLFAGSRTGPGIRVGLSSFQKVKQPLRKSAGFSVFFLDSCASHKNIAFYCALQYFDSAGQSRSLPATVWEKDSINAQG
jgi:hypothetical protein